MIKTVYALTFMGGLLSCVIHLMNQSSFLPHSDRMLWILLAMLVFCAVYLAPSYLGQRYYVQWSLSAKLILISLVIYVLYTFFAHVIAIDEQVVKPYGSGYAVFKQSYYLRNATLAEYQHFLSRNYSMASSLMIIFFYILFNVAYSNYKHRGSEPSFDSKGE